MALTKLRTIDVKGKKFDVSVSNEGKFYAVFDSEQITADSVKQLTDKLADRIAHSKRVSIPVCMYEKRWSDDDGKIRTGVILGLHASNNNLLMKFDDEAKSEQVSYGDFFDPKDAAELKRLSEALSAAEKAFENFKKDREIDAKEKVRELLRADAK